MKITTCPTWSLTLPEFYPITVKCMASLNSVVTWSNSLGVMSRPRLVAGSGTKPVQDPRDTTRTRRWCVLNANTIIATRIVSGSVDVLPCLPMTDKPSRECQIRELGRSSTAQRHGSGSQEPRHSLRRSMYSSQQQSLNQSIKLESDTLASASPVHASGIAQAVDCSASVQGSRYDNVL